MARQAALGAVVFVAALVLLFGLSSVVGPAAGPSGSAGLAASGAATATASGTTTAGSSASAGTSSSTSSSPSAGGSAGPSDSSAPGGSAAASPGSSGSPEPSAAGDAVLVGAGDIADCDLPGDSATAALIDGIDGTVFTAGDDVYPSGAAAQYRSCYAPTWGRVLDRTRPTPGNHDWMTKDLAGYLGYFGDRAAPDGTSWYSFDLGAWHVVMLDSECAKIGGCEPDSKQGRWLAADLAASSARCTVAIWHRPRWSSGSEHGDDASVAPLWQALYAAGADVVVNGHDHDYERFAPQDPDGHEDRARGMREFVVGTGGSKLRDFDAPVANSELRVAGVYGVLKLTLKSNGYDWDFIPTTTDIGDSGSGPCH